MSSYYVSTGTIDNPRLAEQARILYGLSGEDDAMEQQSRLEWLISYYMAMSREGGHFEEKAISFASLVKNCAYNAATCTQENFTSVFHPSYGLCYVFNFHGEASKVTRSGPNYGLKMLLYTNISEYIEATTSIGCRIAIHDQDAYPFPDTFAYSIQPGSAIALSMRANRNERLNAGETKCQDDSEREYLYDG
ncbi:unnamed protein product, partial [Mesorhabditis spiculigera]